jgi:hypothetical protein
MLKAEQIKQLKLLMQRLDDGTTVDAGVMLQNPARVYTCPELAQKEWDGFFRGHPHLRAVVDAALEGRGGRILTAGPETSGESSRDRVS